MDRHLFQVWKRSPLANVEEVSLANLKGAQKFTLVTHGSQILYKYHSLEQQQVNVPLLLEVQKFGIT